MNDILFSNSFFFRLLSQNTFSYTDNRKGAPSHYFAYMLSGRCKIVTDTYTVEINEGDIFYIPDKCSYQSYWYGKPKIEFVSLGFMYFPNFEHKTYPSQVIPKDEKAVKLLLSLSEKTHPTAADIGDFYTLAGILIPNMYHVPVCRSKEIISQTHKYLLSHPFANAAEMAKNCAVSEAALYAAFHKSSDITPNILKNRLLLEKAKELLITTDKTIENISDSLEFSSASYFRKKFKEHFGITPKDMRKKYRI